MDKVKWFVMDNVVTVWAIVDPSVTAVNHIDIRTDRI